MAADAGVAIDAGAPFDGGGTFPDGGWLVSASFTCPSASPVCGPFPAVTQTFASYRKDVSLSDSDYPEQGAAPVNGGRLHIAGVATASGIAERVRINGVLVDDLLLQAQIDWYHVWPREVVAGQPVWVAFHSRLASWDTAQTGTVSVESLSGTLFSATFPVTRTPMPLRYVTTAEDGGVMLVHVMNVDPAPQTISRVIVDGRDVTSATCMPRSTLAPGEHVLLRVPQCTPKQPGAPWTVVLDIAGRPSSVGVGRVVPEFFPIESWVTTSDCPFPGGNAANLTRHQAAGIDTHFTRFGTTCSSGLTGRSIATTSLAGQAGRLRLLITAEGSNDIASASDIATALPDTRFVAGFLTGDESDKDYLTTEGFPSPFPTPETKARLSRTMWRHYPQVPTYNGGLTHKKVGAFAGMADIHGMDFYIAACAPHVTTWGSRMLARGSYDYLNNARNNHAPLPTWLYAQGLSNVWNKTQPLTNNFIRVQPTATEIRYQALSVVAAGGKGLMWFQSNLADANALPDSWNAMAGSGRAIRGVRHWLREGDPAGLASVITPGTAMNPQPVIAAVRARDAIVVTVLSQNVTSEPTDPACAAIFVAPIPRFVFGTHTSEVSVRLPDDFRAADLFEVTTATTPSVVSGPPVTVSGRELRFPVTLDQTAPARIFVIAGDAAARQVAAAATLGP